MKRILSELAPPGVRLRRELSFYALAWLLFVLILSAGYLSALQSALRALYRYEGYARVLIPGAKLPPLSALLDRRFSGFWGYAVFSSGMALAHRLSFSRDSKSIYLMKRVKSAWELPVRCAALPLLALLAGLLLCLALLGVYTLLYFRAAPAGTLPPQTSFSIWRVFL